MSRLSEDETIAATVAGHLVEEASPAVVMPKRGKSPLYVNEAGQEVVKLAIIRPCVSRGKRVNGLPPIYTPSMLAESAGVFTGWPMFLDHALAESLEEGEDGNFDLYEHLAEATRRAGRSVRELGGRIVKSWYDPEFRTQEDDSYGFRPGAVLGEAIPQEFPAQMIARDPEILKVSINAWPRDVREGVAPWNPTQRGMLIEGISDTPPGSVDWVIRPGAGGRVLREDARFAVSIAESLYAFPRNDVPDPKEPEVTRTAPQKPVQEMDDVELKSWLAENRPTVLSAPAPLQSIQEASIEGFVTQEQLVEFGEELTSQVLAGVKAALAERDESAEERAAELVEERDTYRVLAAYAHRLIESSELPHEFKIELKTRYALLPSGPTAALILETEDRDLEELRVAVRESVAADVDRASALVESITPDPVPYTTASYGDLAEGAVREDAENPLVEFLLEGSSYENRDAALSALRESAEG